MLQLAPRIVVDERIRFRRPVIEGTRVPVEVVLGKVAGGMAVEAVAEEYGLGREDVLAALAYAARTLASLEVSAVLSLRDAVVSSEDRRGGKSVFDRITFDRAIMAGRACIRGMRIPVSVIVSQVARGATTAEILQGYPDLEQEDVQQALEYAAWLTREEVRSG